MRIWGIIVAAAALTGCVVPETGTVATVDNTATGSVATPTTARAVTAPVSTGPTFTAPRGTSQRALAALPRGMSPAMLIRDDAGCYGLAIEATEPVRGVPLRDGTGQQVCDA